MIGIGTNKFKLENTSAKISYQGGLVLVDKMAEAMGVLSAKMLCTISNAAKEATRSPKR